MESKKVDIEEIDDNATEVVEETNNEENMDQLKEELKESFKGKADKKKSKKASKAMELELNKKDEEIAELKDKYQRLMAEFENARKRTQKETARMYDIGSKEILEKLLPVVDNFERGLEAVSEEDKDDAFVQGIDAIYKQLMTALEEAGVSPMDSVGKEFNHDYHNAVMHVDDETMGENLVAEEFQKGYMYKDQVLRHGMVKVVN